MQLYVLMTVMVMDEKTTKCVISLLERDKSKGHLMELYYGGRDRGRYHTFDRDVLPALRSDKLVVDYKPKKPVLTRGRRMPKSEGGRPILKTAKRPLFGVNWKNLFRHWSNQFEGTPFEKLNNKGILKEFIHEERGLLFRLPDYKHLLQRDKEPTPLSVCGFINLALFSFLYCLHKDGRYYRLYKRHKLKPILTEHVEFQNEDVDIDPDEDKELIENIRAILATIYNNEQIDSFLEARMITFRGRYPPKSRIPGIRNPLRDYFEAVSSFDFRDRHGFLIRESLLTQGIPVYVKRAEMEHRLKRDRRDAKRMKTRQVSAMVNPVPEGFLYHNVPLPEIARYLGPLHKMGHLFV